MTLFERLFGALGDVRKTASLARIGLGFVGLLAITAPATSLPTDDTPTYVRAERLQNYAFGPLGPAERHAVIGSCEVAIPTIGNDLDSPGAPVRNVAKASFGHMANFVLRHEFVSTAPSGFYDFSAPNTSMAQHTALLYQALRVPGLKSVIYANALSLGHQLPPDDTLELVAVLEALERDFPTAAEAVRAYRALQIQSPAFKAGERRHGPDWRRHLRPAALTFEAPGADTLELRERRPPADAEAQARLQFVLAEGKKMALRLVGGPATLIEMALAPLGFGDRRRDEDVIKELAWAARFHDRPDHDGRVVPIRNSAYLAAEEEMNRRWLVMLAELTKARGARLVFYTQPMLVVPPEDYRQRLNPDYLGRIRSWLAPYDPVIIDQTWGHGLDSRDFALHCPADKPACGPGEYLENGYYATAIGRYKQAQLLIDALGDNGVLAVERRGGPPGWRGESGLAATPRCVRYSDQGEECVSW